MTKRAKWTSVIATIALGLGMLSLYRATDAAPRADPAPFASAIEQRMETVNQLREIHAAMKEQNALLKEQMALLRSGEVKVTIVGLDKPTATSAEKPADKE